MTAVTGTDSTDGADSTDGTGSADGTQGMGKGMGRIDAWVVTVCRDLGLPVAGVGDDFFALGGSSLTAIKLMARAEEEFGEDALPPEDLFERSALSDIAATIEKHSAHTGAPSRE